MIRTHDYSTCKVTITFQSNESADEITKQLDYNGGSMFVSPETMTIVETRRIRLQNKPLREVETA